MAIGLFKSKSHIQKSDSPLRDLYVMFNLCTNMDDKIGLICKVLQNPSQFKECYEYKDIYNFLDDVARFAGSSNYQPMRTAQALMDDFTDDYGREAFADNAIREILVMLGKDTRETMEIAFNNSGADKKTIKNFLNALYVPEKPLLPRMHLFFQENYDPKNPQASKYHSDDELYKAYMTDDVTGDIKRIYESVDEKNNPGTILGFALSTRRCFNTELLINSFLLSLFRDLTDDIYHQCYGDFNKYQDFGELTKEAKRRHFDKQSLKSIIKDVDKAIDHQGKQPFVDKGVAPILATTNDDYMKVVDMNYEDIEL